MYAGFILSAQDARALLQTTPLQEAAERRINDQNAKLVRDKLESFLLNDGAIDADKMQEAWFPLVWRHVFVSHSHKDQEVAIQFAGWLQRQFSITSFIDSSAWGFIDDLLETIDGRYCYDEVRKTYSYQKRNISTTHAHTLLNVALAKMIDRCECVIFIHSGNSIKTKDQITGGEKTESPWIFSELSLSGLIRRRPVEEHRPQPALEGTVTARKVMPNFRYPAPLEHLIPLNLMKLRGWQSPGTAEKALDALYTAHSVKD